MIHIVDDFYIEPDELNWQSFRYIPYNTKGGETKLKKSDIRYHGDLYFAFKRIMEDCKKRSLAKRECEFKEAIADMKRFEKSITDKIITAIETLKEDR